ncbi:hypothetical protein MD484_g5859, partial [Candolleomyces efflorescens]
MYWTKIMLGGVAQKEFLEQMIIRARGLPLDVKVHLDPYLDRLAPTNIDYIWGEATKIRSLVIRGNYLQMMSACVKHYMTVIEAPLLECLALEAIPETKWAPPNHIILALPYQIRAPKLKDITAFYNILPKPSLLPSTLEQLHLAGEIIATPGQHFLPELPRFSQLKRLSLHCTSYFLPPSKAQPIHLPHLTELVAHTKTKLLEYLLTNMEVHPQCSFDLCIDQLQLELPNDLSKVIGKKAKSILQENILEEPFIDLELWKEGKTTAKLLTSSTHTSTEPPRLTLSVYPKFYHTTPHNRALIFSFLLEEIPPVNRMKIRAFGSVDGFLVHILSKPPMLSVTDLTLYDPQPYLWTDICAFERSPTYDIPLPSLEVLRIVGKTDTSNIQQLLASLAHRSTLINSSHLKVIDIRDLDSQDPLYAALSDAEPTLNGLGVEIPRSILARLQTFVPHYGSLA